MSFMIVNRCFGFKTDKLSSKNVSHEKQSNVSKIKIAKINVMSLHAFRPPQIFLKFNF